MSDDATSPEQDAEETPSRDASFKVETSSLSTEEMSFAAALGFGDDPPPAPTKPARTSRPPAAASKAQAEPETASASAPETPVESAPTDAPNETVASDSPLRQASEDWEEIHPRPASEGMQATLQARAEAVLERKAEAESENPVGTGIAAPGSDAAIATLRAELLASQAALEATRGELAAREAEFSASHQSVGQAAAPPAEDEKEIEKLSQELATLSIEHDQMVDQLAATSGRLVQSEARAEKLEVSLRAARGALTPLPEGERALRAEVIGLRGRLEETRQESARMASEFASVATELAIATARVEDRQYEIDYHVERAEALERAARDKESEFETALARHRESLALAARLQAENTELRSTQEALEETLQARDLEISAREEHLRVTREGLSARDQQLVDSNERLEMLRRKTVGLEADLERAAIEREQLIGRIARRESRIATLTETLRRIEEAMGKPLVPPTRGISPPSVSPSQSPSKSLSFDTDDSHSAGPAPLKARRADDPPHALLAPSQPLPAILGSWRDRCLAELVEAADAPEVADFLAARMQASFAGDPPETIQLRSLGGGLSDAEVRLVLALQRKGFESIRMSVVESDAEQAEARRQRVELAGLGEVIDVTVGDLDAWDADGPCHAILLADVLHAQPHLEAILERLAPAVGRGALVLFVGRIGAGPLQLSASTLKRLEDLWEVLPDSLSTSDGLGRPPFRGDDGGHPALSCDTGRALLGRFEPLALAGFGHLADLVVGPTRGFDFARAEEAGMQLLESILAIDESRCLTESLPPRHGVAVLGQAAKAPCELIGQVWPSAEGAAATVD